MLTQVHMSEEEWFENFEPMTNHLNEYGGITFETFGKDVEYIFKLDPHYVWTYVDGDEEPCIVEGRHYVNRLCYYVTRHPWQDNTQYFIEED